MALSETHYPLEAFRPGRSRYVSASSLCLGLAGVVIINLWVTYTNYIVHSSHINLSQFPLAAFVVFFLIVFCDSLLCAVGLKQALRPAEKLTLLAMILVGSVVPTWGFIGFFLGILASPYYYATPENRWAEYFHDYIPSWMAPVDRANGLKWFFEGLPPDVAAPLSVWYVPLFWWFCFIAAVALASLCIGAMMRKQWVEYEKLDYPLIQVGIDISEKSSGIELMPEFMRGKLFWIGMAIPFGMVCWNILSYFWPAAPEFPFAARNFTIATGFPWFSTNISFYTFAFSFFASLEVLFSMWFFFLFFIVQAGVLNRIGYTIGSSLDPWSSYDAITGWQSWGAFFFMVVWGLFIARKHLREVVKKALDTTYPVDDSGEIVSYRTAVFGLAGSLCFLVFWLACAGMEYKLAIPLILFAFTIYTGLAKMVAQSGLLYARAPMTPQAATLYLLGTAEVPRTGLTVLAFTYVLVARSAGLFMPALAHTARLADVAKERRKGIGGAVMLALAVGIAASTGYTLYLGYTYGAFNFNEWVFAAGSQRPFYIVMNTMTAPFSTDWRRLLFFGLGAGLMALLTFLRYRFPWWPVHPIGLAFSPTFVMHRIGWTLFMAWGVKTMIMKIGGVMLYRRFRPFVVGLLVGWALGVTLLFGVDAIWFSGGGHRIHSY